MVTEKIKAAAKQAASALSGKAGILNTLEGEHAEVLSLMEKILSASSAAKAAESHYPTMRRKLLLHLRAEQDVLYPACEARPKTASTIASSRTQHDAIEKVVQELDGTPVDSMSWRDQLHQLHQLAQEHMQEEEDVLFVQCEDAFENHELRDLDRKYDEARTRHHAAITEVAVTRSSSGYVPPPGP